jgi:DNA-binding transcriptional ArsR family regulator
MESLMYETDGLSHSMGNLEIACALRTLTNPVRLQILDALTAGRRTVTELCDLLGIQQSVMSNHLMRLRLEGFVTNKREGHYVYYALYDKGIGDIIAALSRTLPPAGGIRGRNRAAFR